MTANRWFNLPDIREKRSTPAAACLPGDSRVFVFGGRGSTSFLASVEFCRLEADWEEATTTSARIADFWQAAAPMRTARYAPAAKPFRGRIIVAGGWNRQGSLKVVEMFTPPDASSPLVQWTKLARMKQNRTRFTLLTTAYAIFAFGSASGTGNSIEMLTPPATSVDSGNDLTSWVWSSKDPVETLDRILGAASILL
ncbi:unnamed protein product [Schistocephalus solidus]|uniref:Uncharacterized protein n=1 Tax=Schistocephalus solidus TaxID=70667 RepID=A0A183TUP5_SCHSO|nr:unnamed protein product [Schistocephalus solidus]